MFFFFLFCCFWLLLLIKTFKYQSNRFSVILLKQTWTQWIMKQKKTAKIKWKTHKNIADIISFVVFELKKVNYFLKLPFIIFVLNFQQNIVWTEIRIQLKIFLVQYLNQPWTWINNKNLLIARNKNNYLNWS